MRRMPEDPDAGLTLLPSCCSTTSSTVTSLPFPCCAFRFPGRLYFLEVHRLLRPGGFFVLVGAPVASTRMARLWDEILVLTGQLCWQLKQLSVG